jgi:AraC-like DNA-binding protein
MQYLSISTNSLANLCFYHHCVRYEEDFSWRTLPCFTFVYVDTGTWIIGEEEQYYEVGPGEGVILIKDRYHHMKLKNPGQLHRHYCAHFNLTGGWKCDNGPGWRPPALIDLRNKFLVNLPDENIILPQHFKVGNPSYIEELLKTMLRYWESDRYYAKHQAGFVLMNLLMEVSRNYLENMTASQAQPVSKTQRIVEDCIRFIESNYQDNIRVSEIARKINVNPSYLGTVFKQATGMHINHYILQLRVHKVQTLLETTELNAREMAEIAGFYDQYHLSRSFKSITGLTLTQYKTVGCGKVSCTPAVADTT